MQFKRIHVILASVLVALLVLVLSVVGYFSGLKSEGVDRETALSAQYQDNQNELSKYVSGFYEMLGVAGKKSETLEAVLVDAVKGRYDAGSTASPVGGEMFSALVEAYPDLSQLDVYDQVVSYVASNREAYSAKQTKLLDMLRGYENWRSTGLVQEPMVSMMGFPSDTLVARVGNSRTSGAPALEEMHRIVLTEDAVDAYESGTMDPLTVE